MDRWIALKDEHYFYSLIAKKENVISVFTYC